MSNARLMDFFPSSAFRTHTAAIFSSGLQTDDLSSVWQCRKNWVGQDLSGRHLGGSFMIHNGNSKVSPFTPYKYKAGKFSIGNER